METGEVDQINAKPFNKEHQRKRRQCPTPKAAPAADVGSRQHFDGVRSMHYIRREDAVVVRVEAAQPARESARDCEVEHEVAGLVHAGGASRFNVLADSAEGEPDVRVDDVSQRYKGNQTIGITSLCPLSLRGAMPRSNLSSEPAWGLLRRTCLRMGGVAARNDSFRVLPLA